MTLTTLTLSGQRHYGLLIIYTCIYIYIIYILYICTYTCEYMYCESHIYTYISPNTIL